MVCCRFLVFKLAGVLSSHCSAHNKSVHMIFYTVLIILDLQERILTDVVTAQGSVPTDGLPLD
jgi:hypothetical protein